MEKQKKKWYKRWWMIPVYIFVGMILLGMIVGDDSTTSTSSSSGSANQNTASSIITTSSAQMLPTREDIDTEYKIGTPEDVTVNASGFTEGKRLTVDKIEGSIGVIQNEYTIYKFSDAASAKAYYDSTVQSVKNEGGYKDFKIASNCFGYEEDYGFQAQFGTGICVKNNVVYQSHVTIAQAFASANRLAKDGANLLTKKVK